MRLPARKFAIALWLGAAIVLLNQWVQFPRVLQAAHNAHANNMAEAHAILSWDRLFLSTVLFSVIYAGGLFCLGAAIWILGEIRDRLAPQEDVTFPDGSS